MQMTCSKFYNLEDILINFGSDDGEIDDHCRFCARGASFPNRGLCLELILFHQQASYLAIMLTTVLKVSVPPAFEQRMQDNQKDLRARSGSSKCPN